MRVAIADDGTLFREGLVMLLDAAGHEVVAALDDGDQLLAMLGEHDVDIAVLDIRMPPGDEGGLSTAARIRAQHPQIGLLLLSHYAESHYLRTMLSIGTEGIGYRLKERIASVQMLNDTLERILAREIVIEPVLASRLVEIGEHRDGAIGALGERELDVLRLMAEGRANRSIAEELFVSVKAVEKHVASLFVKLGIPEDATMHHRRVLAVLSYLQAQKVDGLGPMTAQAAPRDVVEVLATTPREALALALLENLARGLTVRGAVAPQLRLLRRFADGHHQQIAAWIEEGAVPSHAEPDRHLVPGVGVLEIRPAPDLAAARRRRLVDETCAWLGATVRAARSMRTLDRARRDALQRETDAERAQVRAARVREGERIRLVETITTATVHDLAGLREMLAAPADSLEWPAIHAFADRLIDDLRDAVRGVFPAMLPDRGVEETLRELAAALPVPVDVVGDLGRRAGWDIESGFYHAVAGTLTAIARTGASATVALHHGAALVATVASTTPLDGPAVARLLVADAERIASLGGELVARVREGDAGVEVTVTMPDRGEVTSLPIGNRQIAARPVHGRVATLVEVAALGDDEREACRDALVAPIVLLVVQGPLPAPMPGVQTVLCDAAPDVALADEIRARDGRWGAIDAVVCALAPRPGFAARLRPGQLLFRDGIAPAEAVAELAARAPVLAARRVLERLAEHAADDDAVDLRWQIDEVRAGAHELVEDVLLDEIARGEAPAVVDASAARLAGAEGGELHTRLGLPVDAEQERVRAAALAAVEHWQRVAARPGLGSAGRRAVEVLERSAVGLLVR